MKLLTAFSVALSMALMLSPGSLILLGNSIGATCSLFLLFIPVAIGVQIITAMTYGQLHSLFPRGGEGLFLKEALGPIPAIAVPLCSRVCFTVCASTGMLVTAGFVFNEVFVYWFPNFAFAFIMLGVLLAINLFENRVAEILQIVSVLTVCLGLIFLCIVALLHRFPVEFTCSEVDFTLAMRAACLGLLLFVGFDLAGSLKRNRKDPHENLTRSMLVGIVLAGALLCLWGFVSMIRVPPDKLAESTIPHTLTARIIMGQSGRITMGIVVLAAACGAVNALLMSVSRWMADMAFEGLLPFLPGTVRNRPLFPLLLLTAGTASMMAAGIAGSPNLDTYIRAGLLFWLLHYALIHLSALILKKRTQYGPKLPQGTGYMVSRVLSMSLILAGFIGLMWWENDAASLIKSMAVISVVALGIGLIGRGLYLKSSKIENNNYERKQ